MELLICVLLAFGAEGDDAYRVTLAFQTTHCEACKEELATALENIPGRKSVTLADKTAVVLVEEKTKFDLGRFRAAAPRDMKLLTVRLRLRGKVADAGSVCRATARGSAQLFELRNPEKRDVLGELRKQLGGDNKFALEGVAVTSSAVELHSFEKISYEE